MTGSAARSGGRGLDALLNNRVRLAPQLGQWARFILTVAALAGLIAGAGYTGRYLGRMEAELQFVKELPPCELNDVLEEIAARSPPPAEPDTAAAWKAAREKLTNE